LDQQSDEEQKPPSSRT
jgi:hypothetical protein